MGVYDSLHVVAEKEDPSHEAILVCCFGGWGHGNIILGCLVVALMRSYASSAPPAALHSDLVMEACMSDSATC